MRKPEKQKKQRIDFLADEQIRIEKKSGSQNSGQVIEKYWNCVRNTNTVTRIYRMRFESYMKNGMSHIKQNKQHLHESRRDPVTSYMML